jgi:hypothetical protein
MDQANRVLSTPPTNTPISQADVTSRRRFLSQAAGVAAGGTVLALATMPPASASTAPASMPDPVFALIEAHKDSYAAVGAAYTEMSRLESLGDWDSDGGTGAADTDEWNALADLVEVTPTTLAGVIASITYAAELMTAGAYRGEDDLILTLFENLAEALEGLAVST